MEKFISEECYNEILNRAAEIIAEEFINELNKDTIKSYISKRVKNAKEAEEKFLKAKKEGTATREMLDDYLSKSSKAQYAREKGGSALHYSATERKESKENLEDQKRKGLR